MISLQRVKFSDADVVFVQDGDPDRVVKVRRCEGGENFCLQTNNGPGRVKFLGLSRDTAERVVGALIDALQYTDAAIDRAIEMDAEAGE